jgi:hypothetical protein
MEAVLVNGRLRGCKSNLGGIDKLWLFPFVKYNRSQIVTDGNILVSFPTKTIYRFNYNGNPAPSENQSENEGGKFYDLGLSFDLRTANSYQVPLKFNALDANTADWTITTGEVDFEPSVLGKDHVFNIGYNWDASLLGHPQMGQQMEATYEMTDTTLVSEWFSYYNSKSLSPSYSGEPFK